MGCRLPAQSALESYFIIELRGVQSLHSRMEHNRAAQGVILPQIIETTDDMYEWHAGAHHCTGEAEEAGGQ